MSIEKLREAFPFPFEEKPNFEFDDHGWHEKSTKNKFKEFVNADTKIVVEIGSWLGKSLRSLAELAPNAFLISCDTWLGSSEHNINDGERKQLKTLYETFISNCWNLKDRLTVLRMDSITAIKVLKHFGIQPDFVYLDAGHEYDSVSREIKLLFDVFPNAQITGDDYNNDVKVAIDEFCNNNSKQVNTNGLMWWIKK